MPDSPPIKRTYNSTLRRAQSLQTRRQILAAAGKLFVERGYAGATLEAIAQEAGVSLETVYAVFKNKQTLLARLIDVTVVGDDEPIPLLQRPFILGQRNEQDQRVIIQKFAADIYVIMQRMSPLFALLRAAAKTEPDIAVLLSQLLKGRLQGMSFLIEQLVRTGQLRVGPAASQAAETAWALSSAEVFHLLTVDLAWSREQYVDWLSDALIRVLLP